MSDGPFPRPPRAYPPRAPDDADRRAPSSDPLLELARLIGQSDPFGPPPSRSGESPRSLPDLPTRGPMARPPSRAVSPEPDRYEAAPVARGAPARPHPFPSLQTFPSRSFASDDRAHEDRAHDDRTPTMIGASSMITPAMTVRRSIAVTTDIPSRPASRPRRPPTTDSNFPRSRPAPGRAPHGHSAYPDETYPTVPEQHYPAEPEPADRTTIATRIRGMRGWRLRARMPPTRKREITRANMPMPRAIGTTNMTTPTAKRAPMRMTNPAASGAIRSRSGSRCWGSSCSEAPRRSVIAWCSAVARMDRRR